MSHKPRAEPVSCTALAHKERLISICPPWAVHQCGTITCDSPWLLQHGAAPWEKVQKCRVQAGTCCDRALPVAQVSAALPGALFTGTPFPLSGLVLGPSLNCAQRPPAPAVSTGLLPAGAAAACPGAANQTGLCTSQQMAVLHFFPLTATSAAEEQLSLFSGILFPVRILQDFAKRRKKKVSKPF